MQLRPGQRHPTAADREASWRDLMEPPIGHFPTGVDWEITPERAARWYAHGFAGFRGDSQLMRRLGPLEQSELALFLWDLSCYEGLLQRYLRGQGPQPPPIHEYLQVGREQWGEIARWLRELEWLEDGAA